MSLPVLIGFAGVLVAAVATGMLGGRCVRQPRMDFIAWTAATVALTVALAAQSVGFARGFDPATFRAVQLFGLLLAPLWLAWGLVESVATSGAARFAMRLVVGALTAVGGVILVTDPLTAQAFGKSWPRAALHYQPVSHDVLDVVQLLAVITAAAAVGLAAVRARNDRQRRAALTGIAAIGVAVLLTVAPRFSLPARSAYPLLALLAAGLVWFGVTRLQGLPGQAIQTGRPGRARGRYAQRDRHEASGHGRRRDPRVPLGSRRPVVPGGSAGPGDSGASGWGDTPGGPADAGRRAWYPGGSDPVGLDQAGRPLAPREAQPAQPLATGAATALAGADGEFGQPAKPAGLPPAKPARPYGRIVIFTLLEDRVADFDRLAEQTAEEVRTGEPDTLVYVIHLVPNAPMQRIFYEIYRDRDAFDAHESQRYIQRFVAERRSCVLATNVIELRLKFAKVAPLPHSQPTGPATQPGALAQMPPRQPAALPAVPPGQPEAWATGQVQSLEPLPPGPGPERRRLPSAGRRYGGA